MERSLLEALGSFLKLGFQHECALLQDFLKKFLPTRESILSRLQSAFLLDCTQEHTFEPAAAWSQSGGDQDSEPLPFPDDVTLLVFRKLAAQDCRALARASCTCRGLNRLAGEEWLWREAHFKDLEDPLPDGLMDTIDAFGGYRVLSAVRASGKIMASPEHKGTPELYGNFENLYGDFEFLFLECLDEKLLTWTTLRVSDRPYEGEEIPLADLGERHFDSIGDFVECLIHVNYCIGFNVLLWVKQQQKNALLECEEAQRGGLTMQGFARNRKTLEVTMLYNTYGCSS
jgi:hypothetical protein